MRPSCRGIRTDDIVVLGSRCCQDCRKPHVHELPFLTELVRTMDVNREDRVRSALDVVRSPG